ARRGAAAEIVERRPERRAEGDLDVPRAPDVTREAEELGAAATAEAREPGPALGDDGRHGAERLDVVDDGRLAPEPRLDGEGRARAGHRPIAFDRLEERGLLAQDEAAGAATQLDIEREVGCEDALAEEPPLARLRHGDAEALGRKLGLPVDIEDRARGAGRGRGGQRGLEEPVRVALHQVAILEDAGLAFLAVDDEVLRGALRLAARCPLHRRLEVGAAAPGEARRAHLLDHPLGPRVLERVHQRRVRPVADRIGDVRGVRETAALEQDAPLTPEPVVADVGRRGGVRRQRVEESRDVLGGDVTRRESRTAVAQDLDDRLSPAHAVAACGDDGEWEAAALDLDAEHLERLARADGAPARSQADGEARARAPALRLAPAPSDARRRRAGPPPARSVQLTPVHSRTTRVPGGASRSSG